MASTRPEPSSKRVQRRMSLQRTRDTGPELALCRAAHRLGLRYRVHVAVLPGLRVRADMAFVRAKVAVFVDGCFWHVCPEHATRPKTNAAWWADKLAHNVERDRSVDAALARQGWISFRVWEHDDPNDAARRLCAAVRERVVRLDVASANCANSPTARIGSERS
jgi:DNA mismatch endonuclease, patch repair protein